MKYEKEELKQTYDRIAKDWHENHQTDDWWVEGTEKFISLLNKNNSVLDAGCGAGTKSKYLASKGLAVTGIDFSKEMIQIAKQEVPEATFKVLSFADVDQLNDTFDGIFMQASLLHVPKANAAQVVATMARKLRTGGYYYIAVKETRSDRPEEEIRVDDDLGYIYKRFFSYYTVDEIKGLFEAAGLQIVYETVTPSGPTGKTRWIQMIAQK